MPDNAPSLSVIIVNVDTAKWLKPCLESLQEQEIFDSVEVVVVDNGSGDGSAGMVRQDFPDVKLVRLEETVGFGTANNYGAKHSSAPVLLFLNPDTILREASLSTILSRLAEHPHCGIAGRSRFRRSGQAGTFNGIVPDSVQYGIGTSSEISSADPPASGTNFSSALGRLRQTSPGRLGYRALISGYAGKYLKGSGDSTRGFSCTARTRTSAIGSGSSDSKSGSFLRRQSSITAANPACRAPRKKMLYESLRYFAEKHYKSPGYWMTRIAFRTMSKR